MSEPYPHSAARDRSRDGLRNRFEFFLGLNRQQTHLLRSGEGGRLKSQTIDGEEYPCFYFAEDIRPNSALAPLIGRFVGVDALSQALTNPLLTPSVFTPQTFSPLGMDIIAQTHSLSGILHRNIPRSGKHLLVTMTQPRQR